MIDWRNIAIALLIGAIIGLAAGQASAGPSPRATSSADPFLRELRRIDANTGKGGALAVQLQRMNDTLSTICDRQTGELFNPACR